MRTWLHTFDKHWTARIQHWPDWTRLTMLFATLIGQPLFTVGTATLIAGIGWGASNMGLFAAGVVAAVTFCVCTLAKLYFRRDRPMTEYVARMRFDTYSMPSGHAAGTVASYGLLTFLIWQVVPTPWQYIASSLIALFVVLIGVSRIYLGAHYPSDIIAGWLLGFAGLATIILVVQPQI